MSRNLEPFRTTTLLTFVIGIAEIVWLYALVARTPDERARIPLILDSLLVHALGLFVLSGLVALLLIWRLTPKAIPGIITGAFASLAVLDTDLIPKVVPVNPDGSPQYLPALLCIGVVSVALGICRKRLGTPVEVPT